MTLDAASHVLEIALGAALPLRPSVPSLAQVALDALRDAGFTVTPPCAAEHCGHAFDAHFHVSGCLHCSCAIFRQEPEPEVVLPARALRQVSCPRTDPHEPHNAHSTSGNPGSRIAPDVACPGIPPAEASDRG